MFFSQKKQILFLKRNSLDFLDQSGKVQVSCSFPENVIHNLEIENIEQFEVLIDQFVKKFEKSKMEVILALSDQLVFYKSYPLQSTPTPAQSQFFLNTVPFEQSSLWLKQYPTKQGINFLAVNKNTLLAFKKALEKSGWVVKTIVAASIFGKMNPDNSLSQEVLQQLDHKDKLIKDFNFLNI